MKFLVVSYRGSDDVTMATIPWVAAKTASEQGDEVTFWLFNEAVNLARVKDSALDIKAPGLPPLADVKSAVENKVSLYVCKPCWVARNGDTTPAVGTLAGMPDFINHTKAAERVVTF